MKNLLKIALCLVICPLAGTAFAQTTNTAPPAEKYVVTPGGVDMRTGKYVYRRDDASIGNAGGGLVLTRTESTQARGHPAPFATMGHNFDIFITESLIRISTPAQQGMYEHVPGRSSPDYRMIVYFGGRAETFDSFGTTTSYTGMSQNERAILTFTGTKSGAVQYTYTGEDGTTIVFRALSGTECSNWHRCAYATSVTTPNGIIQSFDYESVSVAGSSVTRLRRVTDNRGHGILFNYNALNANPYQVEVACALNASVTATSALTLCSSILVPRAQYAYNGSAKLGQHTDQANNAHGFGYGTAGSISFYKPGYANPYLVNTANSNDVVSLQSFGDGSAYSYLFTNIRGDGDGNVAGGSYTNLLNQTTTVTFEFPVLPRTGPPTGTTRPQPNYQVTPGPTKIIDPLGRQTTLNYCDPTVAALPVNQGGGCLVSLLQYYQNPEGDRATFTYTLSNRNVVQVVRAPKPSTGLSHLTASSTYDCSNIKFCAKPITSTDPKGNVTNYTYDPTHGGILTETLPAAISDGVRPQRRYTYGQYYAQMVNSSGVLVQAATPVWLVSSISECRISASCAGTADETRSNFSYAHNNLYLTSKTVTAGDSSMSATTSWTYDSFGNKLTEDGPLPGTDDTSYWFYDLMRRVVGQISPDPDGAGPLLRRAVRNTYDAAGRLTLAETGTVTGTALANLQALSVLNSITATYDILDRKVKTVQADGFGTALAVTQYNYDTVGRPLCIAVRMAPSVWSGQADACMPQTTGPNGPDRITKLVYNAAGEIVETRVAVGTALDAAEKTNSYTLNGKLQTVKDGENNLTTFEYDGHDRLAKTRYPVAIVGAVASSTTDYEQLTYDANSNVVMRRLRDGQLINLSFDALNRVTLKDVPNAVIHEYDISYQYDLQGRIIQARDSNTHVSNTVYDALGRMVSDSSNWTTRSYQYDAAGRRTRFNWGDGFYVDTDYLTTGEVSNIRELGATSGIGVLATYGYDNSGKRTSLTRGNGAVTNYAYDGIDRLTSLNHDFAGTTSDVTATLGYNPASQTTIYTRDNDSYRWFGHYDIDRAYGANGLNQLIATTPGVGQTSVAALGYDVRGNLSTSGASSYGYTSENRMATAPGGYVITYDPLGRLHWISNSALKWMQYDGTDLIEERDSTGVLRRYVHGPGHDEPLVWYEGAGTTDRRWYHQDERASVVAISNSAGSVIAINSYDEYGIPSTTNQGRFQYTGQTWLPEIGLYYYKARIYSPYLGRFMQTDPIGYKDGINWYDYAGGDSVNHTDPTGTDKVCTTESNSRINRCVYVDGNGDGNTKDNDLNAKQENKLASEYRGFILGNAGRNISGFTKPVSGNGDITMARAVSQFAGAAMTDAGEGKQWSGISSIVALSDKGIGGRATCGGKPAYECVSMDQPHRIYITGMRLGWGSVYSSPSELGRLMIHATLHLKYGARGLTGEGHVDLDNEARSLLKSSGLGDGGCSGETNFLGIQVIGGIPPC